MPDITKFEAAMQRYAALAEAGQGDTREAGQALNEAFDHAPAWFIEGAKRRLAEAGLKVPEPCGLDSAGRPVYAVTDIAAAMGVELASVVGFMDGLGIEPATMATRVQ
ncbi:hypothetical protein JCM19379_22810 [Methyloparacoccus murrellii]